MTEERSYCIGLPVVITVRPDGTVTYEPDLSEAADLRDGMPTDDQLVPLYSEAEVDADIATVSADVDRVLAARRSMPTDAERVARMKAEILDDIEAGHVPDTVRTYSELHDYRDANGYGGFFDEPVDEEHIDQFNRCSDVVDEWLRMGRPAGTRWLTIGELRRATSHLPDDTPITATAPGGDDWLNLALDLSGIPKGEFCGQCGRQVRWIRGSGWVGIDDQAHTCTAGPLGYHEPVAHDDPPSIILDTRDDFDTRQW